jgi:hypothetical protein
VADDVTRAPDLAAASPQPPSDDGLMSALRQSQVSPLASNPMFQMGSALQGFASGMRGQNNPALTFLEHDQANRERQIRTQMQLSQIQDRKKKEQASQAKSELEILQGLMSGADTMSPEAKSALGKDFSGTWKRAFGSEVNPLYVDQVLNKPLSNDRLKQLILDRRAGLSPEAVADKYKVPIARVGEYEKMVQDPIALKTLFGMNVDDLDLAGTRAAHTRTSNWAQEHGYTLGSDRWRDLTTVATEMFKKAPMDLSPTELVQAQGKAQLALEAREQQKEQRHLQNQLTIADATARRTSALEDQRHQNRLDLEEAKRKGKQLDPAKAIKLLEPIRAAGTVSSELDKMLEGYEAMATKGLVPKSTGLLSAVGAKATQMTRFNDPDWKKFTQLWGPRMIGLVDRGAFDEKGVRAVSVFKNQLDATTGLPMSVEAMRSMIRELKDSSRTRATTQLETLKAVNAPDEVIQRAQEMVGGLASGPSGASGKIRVRRKADGKTGTIDAGDFDPAKYEKQ